MLDSHSEWTTPYKMSVEKKMNQQSNSWAKQYIRETPPLTLLFVITQYSMLIFFDFMWICVVGCWLACELCSAQCTLLHAADTVVFKLSIGLIWLLAFCVSRLCYYIQFHQNCVRCGKANNQTMYSCAWTKPKIYMKLRSKASPNSLHFILQFIHWFARLMDHFQHYINSAG